MYHTRIRRCIGIVVAFCISFCADVTVHALQSESAFAPVGSTNERSARSVSAHNERVCRTIDVNNFRLPVSNYGMHGLNMETNRAGGEWPQGSGEYYLFGAGVWIGGTVDQEPFSETIGGSTVYSFRESTSNPLGWNGLGKTYDASGSRAVLTDPRVAMSYEPSGGQDEFSALTPIWFCSDADWPLSSVRSILDTYCEYDDQDPEHWYTGADGNSGHDTGEWSGEPTDSLIAIYGLGVKVSQTTYSWNYGQNEDIHFITMEVENIRADGKDINNCFVGIIADPDIGNEATDDLAGFDAERNLGYAYDSDFDEDGFSEAPGFIGYKFLRGALAEYDIDRNGDGVVNNSPVNIGGIDVYDIWQGWNIGLHSFKIFGRLAGDPSTEWERYMALSGHNFKEDQTQSYQPYDLTSTPEDQRFLMTTGPFTLKQGDPAEIVVALMAAPPSGTESDPVTTRIAGLQTLSDQAQAIFDMDFMLPEPPVAPMMELEAGVGAVSLAWTDMSEHTADPYYQLASDPYYSLYDPDYREYDFAGYRLWRSLTGHSADWELVGDFSGESLVHTYIDRDVINGRIYHYALTAYDSQPNEPVSLETARFACTDTVRPINCPDWSGQPGYVAAEHIAGHSEGTVDYRIVEWSEMTGHTYQVGFNSDMTWFVKDVDLPEGSNIVLDNQPFQSGVGDNDYPIVDGLLIRVECPELCITDVTYDPVENQWMVPCLGNIGTDGVVLGKDFYGTVLSDTQYVPVEIRFSSTATSVAPVFVKNLSVYGYSGAGTFPGEVYDMSVTPPRRLAVACIEVQGYPTQDMQWFPALSYSAREFLLILNQDYDENTSSDAWNWFSAHDVLADRELFPTMYGLALCVPNDQLTYENGDVMSIVPRRVNSSCDVFEFSTSHLPVQIDEQDARPVEYRLSVYPNPFNPVTTVHYGIRDAGRASVGVYNLLGQQIRMLAEARHIAGNHSVSWNGRDDAGRMVASGVYMVRLIAAGATLTQRIVLVR